MQNADESVDDCLSCADYSPTYKIILKADAESATGPVCEWISSIILISVLTFALGM